MNDIVERLLHPGHGPLADEAAQEIKRLRGLLDAAGWYLLDAPEDLVAEINAACGADKD